MSTEKDYTNMINDPAMDPYFITMDNYCVTVNLRVTPDRRYTDSTKEFNKIIGHHSSVGSAVKTIAKAKANNQSYSSLKEYVDHYQTIVNQLTENTNY